MPTFKWVPHSVWWMGTLAPVGNTQSMRALAFCEKGALDTDPVTVRKAGVGS
jgi:hypothetical protein